MDTYGIYGHYVEGEMKRAAEILDTVYGAIIKK